MEFSLKPTGRTQPVLQPTGEARQPTTDELRQLVHQPRYTPSLKDAERLYDAKKSRSFGSKLKGAFTGAKDAFAYLYGLPGKARAEWKEDPSATRLASSVIQGTGRGLVDLGLIGVQAGNKAKDLFQQYVHLDPAISKKSEEQIAKEKRETAIRNYHQRLLNQKFAAELRGQMPDLGDVARTLPMVLDTLNPATPTPLLPTDEQRELSDKLALGAGNVASAFLHKMTGRPAPVLPDVTPYESVSEIASFVGDPTLPVTGGIMASGKLGVSTGAKAMARQAMKEAAMSAGERAGAATLRKTGRAVGALGAAPEAVTKATLKPVIGAERAAAVGEVVAGKRPAVPALASVGAAAAGIPLPGLPSAIPAGIRATKAAGTVMERLGQLGQQVAGKDRLSQVSRLIQVARDPNAPAWMKAYAKNLERLRGPASIVKETGKGAAVGGAVGATFGAAATDSPEEFGAAVGTGVGIGAPFGLGLYPVTRRGKLMAAQHADLMRFAQRQVSEGRVTPEALARVGDSEMLAAATLEQMFEGQSRIQFVDAENFARMSGEPGSAGYYVDADGSIVINVEARRAPGQTVLHEIGHALARSQVVNQPEVRLLIDTALQRAGMDAPRAKARYAEQIIRQRKRNQGDQNPTVSSEEVEAYIRDADSDSASRHGDPNEWIYGEIYAESALRGLYGKNIFSDILSPGLTGRALEMAENMFERLGVKFKPGAKPDTILPGFEDVIDSPALRKMVWDHVRRRNKHITGLSAERDQGIRITPRMHGQHPAVPVHNLSNGARGNDYVVEREDGSIVNRRAFQVRQIVRGRRREVNAAYPSDGLPAAVGDADPNVKLRTTVSGQVQRTGSRLGPAFDNLTSFSDATKAQARMIEAAIAEGRQLSGWYQQIGSGPEWRASVRRDTGAIEAQFKDFVPFAFRIDKQGNILVQNYSLSSFERKARRWQNRHGDLSLDFWSGDVEAFRQDVRTYLDNHANGRPGDAGLGAPKRDLINAFLIGGNRQFEARNPLRPQLRGEDRAGLVRSYRLDRLETVEAGDPFPRPDYHRQVQNLSPDAEAQAVLDEVLADPNRLDKVHSPDVNKRVKDALPHAVGKPLKLVHFSGRSGLKSVDPSHFGKGKATPTDLRGEPKTYFFVEGSKLGQDVNLFGLEGQHVYLAEIDGKRIYNVNGRDPLSWRSTVNRAKADDVLMDAGYEGLYIKTADGRTVVALFKPQKVKKGRARPGKTVRVHSPDVEMKSAVEDARLESKFADDYLADRKELSEFPYYESYRQTIADEAAQIGDPKSLLFVGSGPVPLSPMLFSEQFPAARISVADIDGPALKKGAAVAEKAGVQFAETIKADAASQGLKGYDTVVVALEAGPTGELKSGVVKNVLSQVDPNTTVLLRSSKTDDFVKVSDKDLDGWTIAARIPTFDGYGESIVLKSTLAPREKSGLMFKDFFSRVTKGEFGKSDVPFEPVLDVSGQSTFLNNLSKHRGNFDEHIAKSIPTFMETQIRKGQAIVDTFGEGASVLDVGASEGSFVKAITETSGGKIKTVALDPNPDMAKFFAEKSSVDGSTYSTDAFLAGFEDDGVVVKAYNPEERFDVVHEAMVFQFISPDRGPQVAEARRLLKPDGVALFEEKVRTADWAANEVKKDSQWKDLYFTKKELAAKDKVVGFKQSKQETKAVGMVDNMVSGEALEAILGEHFKYVVQYWDSGNFRGYAASDDPVKLKTLVDNMGDLNSDFSTSQTPREVTRQQNSPDLNKRYEAELDIGDLDAAGDIVAKRARQAGFTHRVFRGAGQNPLKTYRDVIFVTPNEGYAREYGGKVHELFVKANPYKSKLKVGSLAEFAEEAKKQGITLSARRLNPYQSIKGKPDEIHASWPDLLNSRKVVRYLKRELKKAGFDAISGIEEASAGVFPYMAVFDPEHVKSVDAATFGDNNRYVPLKDRFNTSKADARYSPDADPTAVPLQPRLNKSGKPVMKAGKPIFETQRYDLLDAPLVSKILEAQPDPAAARELVFGRNGIRTKLNTSSLGDRKPMSPEQQTLYNDIIKSYAEEFATDYARFKDDPDVRAAMGWYSEVANDIAELFPNVVDREHFLEFLGGTSPNTSVEQNFLYAVDLYNRWKAGDLHKYAERTNTVRAQSLDSIVDKYAIRQKVMRGAGKKRREVEVLKLKPGVRREFVKVMADDLNTGVSPASYKKALAKARAKADALVPQDLMMYELLRSDAIPRRIGGGKYGVHTDRVIQIINRTWEQLTNAPKAVNFTGNLKGLLRSATIDVWAARLLRRLGYERLSEGPWRLQPLAEQGVQNFDFFLGQDVFEAAAKRIAEEYGDQMHPDDLQALMWFAEKREWATRGWAKAEDLGDFRQYVSAAKVGDDGRLGLRNGELNFTSRKFLDTLDLPVENVRLRAVERAERKALEDRRAAGKDTTQLEAQVAKHPVRVTR